MKSDILVKKLEDRLNYYFIIVKRDNLDTKIIALNKNTNDSKMSFLFDENNNLVYNINTISIGFGELYKIVEVINDVIS